MRQKIALALVRLARRIDGRPGVTFSISYQHPQTWSGIKRTQRDLAWRRSQMRHGGPHA